VPGPHLGVVLTYAHKETEFLTHRDSGYYGARSETSHYWTLGRAYDRVDTDLQEKARDAHGAPSAESVRRTRTQPGCTSRKGM